MDTAKLLLARQTNRSQPHLLLSSYRTKLYDFRWQYYYPYSSVVITVAKFLLLFLNWGQFMWVWFVSSCICAVFFFCEFGCWCQCSCLERHVQNDLLFVKWWCYTLVIQTHVITRAAFEPVITIRRSVICIYVCSYVRVLNLSVSEFIFYGESCRPILQSF